MWQAVWTEAQGWRDALTHLPTVLWLVQWAVSAALGAVAVIVVAGTLGAPAAVLGTVLVVSGGCLIRLRLGRI